MATINFAKGHPTNSLFPNKTIVEATSSLLLNDRDYDLDPANRHPLTYGADDGALWVREEVSNFVNRTIEPKFESKAEYFNLTGGSSYGLMNILAQSTLPHTGYTKQAFLITPTYFLVNDTFIDAGFSGKMTGIDEKNGSIDFEQFESKLKQFDDDIDHEKDLKIIINPDGSHNKKVYKFVIYCIPTFSNPGGETYDLDTRLKLLELARKYDILIITDDVYDLLDYEQPLDKLPKPLPRITHLDRETYTNEHGNTISNATFSKLIAPGLRFGYQESVNSKLVTQLSQGGANVSGGTPSQLNSMVVGTILKDGLIDDVVNNFRKTYSERAHLLGELIETHLPKDLKFVGLKGGYFTWVTFPSKYDVQKITEELKTKKNVIVANGKNFEVIGDERNWGSKGVRLSISYLTVDEIKEGIQRWGDLMKELYP
ncbi:hypothetical protein BN7_1100 [Wickerhamomyces ciferrii]|uniref:Aminotransferase class I/classII large domain-containing protein n=1 Tax=Wickerhamomyces ciferrii (strain ATCC 14091 / BCRC 22168 / CBS 111 / JCM 3599 / NBRC 0793 / NRRL Y-1031 F-60-10) TaxID=1206466 RepID=K0KJ92_WICCF|nr:uncharacterized protein BN7_1100 [Wickerhamomyces ciferrii]CCH41559.1 hypothetical protein BN7_1100 [Wickerhamomyces ciferrii]